MKLGEDFYKREDVLTISKELLGKFLFTYSEGILTGGKIVETEAYAGVNDKASHAYGGKNTNRTRIMFQEGGHSYVYLCYGIHHLFNVVTNQQGIPHAVLIRGLEPVEGIELMLLRRNKKKFDYTLTSGPGSLSEALGINMLMNGLSLKGDTIWIEDRKISVPEKEIIASPRVGVAYAKEDALLPYRFRIKDNPWTSKAK